MLVFPVSDFRRDNIDAPNCVARREAPALHTLYASHGNVSDVIIDSQNSCAASPRMDYLSIIGLFLEAWFPLEEPAGAWSFACVSLLTPTNKPRCRMSSWLRGILEVIPAILVHAHFHAALFRLLSQRMPSHLHLPSLAFSLLRAAHALL